MERFLILVPPRHSHGLAIVATMPEAWRQPLKDMGFSVPQVAP